MTVEQYLERFEKDAICGEIPPQPPAYSSFYWRNESGDKFKVFIPTENRQLYYNLEEYDACDIGHLPLYSRWREAKKCVNLAVLKSYMSRDVLVIDQMERVQSKITKRKAVQNWEPSSITSGNSRYYVLIKYFVKDIKNVPLNMRYLHSQFMERVTISPPADQDLIDSINTAFQLSAERFEHDLNHEVIVYNRQPY